MNTRGLVAAFAAVLLVAACSSDQPTGQVGGSSSAAPSQSEFFDQAEYDRQLAMRSKQATGPADKPWEQAIEPQMADTAKYAKPGPYHFCFSNASVDNPWRQVGWKTMQAEVKTHPEITKFTVLDAEAKDDKQISDIAELGSQQCSVLIVSPNTTATLSPAVEKACQTGVPVVVFDRGVRTDCPVTFINPIGGYAFGADAAEFITSKVGEGGKVLALRILPGVDVLENRWAAAKLEFDKKKVNVVGTEFTDGDPAKTKSIVGDYLQRHGKLDGVWMDAGATSVAAIEAFEDAGQPVPPITGEDQQDFLRKWKDGNLPAFTATYPTYQWRTPIIAGLKILQGQQVPKQWKLPQPKITSENLDQYLEPGMPPLHYALCGCKDLPGYPQDWGGTK